MQVIDEKFNGDHMDAIINLAFYERVNFSLTPVGRALTMRQYYAPQYSDQQLAEIISTVDESEFHCNLCKSKLRSNGYEICNIGGRRDLNRPTIRDLRMDQFCQDNICNEVRDFFNIRNIHSEDSLDHSYFDEEIVSEKIEKRRKKAIIKNPKILKKRFSDPKGLLDLLLSEMLRQAAIEKTT